MLDAGMSVTKAAKRLSISRDTVRSAAKAGESAAAMEALDSGQLSLAEAAAISEFEDPDDIARLIDVAGTNRFEHRLAEIRSERESQKAYEEAAAHYVNAGYTVIDEYPRYGDTTCVPLAYLRTPDGSGATEEAITRAAQWAVYLCEDTTYVDNDTGEPVDSDDIDWYSRFDSREPEDGKRHPDSVSERTVFEPEWFCIDVAGAGLALCETLGAWAVIPIVGSTGEISDSTAGLMERCPFVRQRRCQTLGFCGAPSNSNTDPRS